MRLPSAVATASVIFPLIVTSTSTNKNEANVAPILPVSYEPGRLDVLFEERLYLSKGLTAKILARSNKPVSYADGNKSIALFHTLPDGAAVFQDKRENNPGGWVLVSNSEEENHNGGVGALTFDSNGNIIDYRRLLNGTDRNCNGGKTDWDTWISCEESLSSKGKCWQVDPFDTRPPQPIALGSQGGSWETFAHDTRDPNKLYAFLTEDALDGRLSRMTYLNPNYTNPWDILLQPGESLDYLMLEPNSFFEQSGGTFRWDTDEHEARENAFWYYPNTEGMKMDGNILRVVSKTKEGFFQLDLDKGTYTFEVPGFEGEPDQSTTVIQIDGSKVIYFTEEANPIMGFLGAQVGIHARNEAGEYCTILFGETSSPETTGIAFSPDGMHMYFAYQKDGILFDVARTDGHSFLDPTGTMTTVVSEDQDWSVMNLISGLLDLSRKGRDGPF